MLGKDLKISHRDLSSYLRKNKTYSTNEAGLRRIVDDISAYVGLPSAFLLTVLR